MTTATTIRRNTKAAREAFEGKTKAMVVLGDYGSTAYSVEAVRDAFFRHKSYTLSLDADGTAYVRGVGISWTLS